MYVGICKELYSRFTKQGAIYFVRKNIYFSQFFFYTFFCVIRIIWPDHCLVFKLNNPSSLCIHINYRLVLQVTPFILLSTKRPRSGSYTTIAAYIMSTKAWIVWLKCTVLFPQKSQYLLIHLLSLTLHFLMSWKTVTR